MNSPNQAELFARSPQSQVARNPGAACLTLPILRELGVASTVNSLCLSEHGVPTGRFRSIRSGCTKMSAWPVWGSGVSKHNVAGALMIELVADLAQSFHRLAARNARQVAHTFTSTTSSGIVKNHP